MMKTSYFNVHPIAAEMNKSYFSHEYYWLTFNSYLNPLVLSSWFGESQLGSEWNNANKWSSVYWGRIENKKKDSMKIEILF